KILVNLGNSWKPITTGQGNLTNYPVTLYINLNLSIRVREVGGSNPLAPTWNYNSSSLAFSGELFLVLHQCLAVEFQLRQYGPKGQPSWARWRDSSLQLVSRQ